ncbi:MAG: hypothetical protein HJJLKODD_00880 [Phycisphaerae bacterium]|nr:hypothetical protein [Phycisphaerae bacterium]
MSTATSLWSRIGHWIKPTGERMQTPHLAELDYDLTATEPDGEVAGTPVRPTRHLLPWRRQEETLQQLRRGYDEVLNLVGSISQHLASQDQRGAQLVQLLDRLQHQFEELPTAARQTSSAVAQLALQAEAHTRHTQAMATALGDLPRAAAAQTEMLGVISAQLQSSNLATQQLGQQLELLSRAVKIVHDSGAEQIRTLQSMQTLGLRQSEQLVDALTRHHQHYRILLMITLGLAAISAGSTLVGLFTAG